MKILFPSVFYLPKVIGGIELYIHHLALGLQQKGHDIKVVLPSYTDDDINDYNYQGIEVVRYKAYPSKGRLEFAGISANESLENFKKIIAEHKPDIVHFSQLTNSSGISLLHIAAAKEYGAIVVYTNHLSEFICQRGNFRYMGSKACDGIISVSKCTACLLQQKNIAQLIAQSIALVDKYAAVVAGKKNFRVQLKPFVFPGFFTRWHLEKIRTLINIADIFVSIAKWSNILIQKNGWANDKCIFIPTGLLNAEVVVDKTANLYDGKRPLRVVFLGRLVPVKGAAVLIEAAKQLNNNIQLDLYGPVDLVSHKDYYENCLQAVMGFDNIKLYPPVQNDKVVEIISRYDLLCLPSKGNEMAPLIIQECLKAKVPVIATDLPALREWVTDGVNGLLFLTDDAISLKMKLQEVIDHPSLISKFKSKLAAPNNFSDVVNRYHQVYEEKLALVIQGN